MTEYITDAIYTGLGNFFSNRLVQILLALTWARIFFPDWVEAVGTDVVLKIIGAG